MNSLDKFEEFNKLVVNSINIYFNLNEKRDKYFYFIENINLRYALEREMYFTFIFNINYYYSLYINNKMEYTNKRFRDDILQLILNQKVILSLPTSEHIKKEFEPIKKIKGSNTYLVSIISLKFLKYLEPIINKLKYIHLLCIYEDKELLSYLHKSNYTYSRLLFEKELSKELIPSHLKGLTTTKMIYPLLDIINRIKPSVILNTEGCHISDQILSEIGKILKIKTIGIQHGYAPFYPTSFRNMNYSKFLTWGDYFSDGFKEYNQDTKFISVGNHILNNTTNNSIKLNCISFFVQVTKYYITQKHFDDFIGLIIFTAKRYPKIKVMVREHPSNPIASKYILKLKLYPNIIFMNKATHSIGEVLELSDLAVSISSATLVEALESKVVPIYVNTPKVKIFSRLKNTVSSIPMPSDIPEAQDIIMKSIENDTFFKNLKDAIFKNKHYLFKSSGEQAINNIIREIKC